MASSQSSKAEKDLSTLRLTKGSTLSLLNQFTTSLSASHTSPGTPPPANAPNPLDVIHTTATLLKAQTTKLSLLVLNKPFTPSAISTILRDVSTSCLPALMSAVEICDPSTYSKILFNEVRLRVRRVLQEFAGLIEEIPVVDVDGHESKEGAKRDNLASTGVVWEACDSLIALDCDGLVGLVVKKAEEWRAMIKDAIAELKEWSEDEADSDVDDEHDTNEADTGLENDINSNGSVPDVPDDTTFEDIFGTTRKLPKGPSILRTQLESSLSKLSLTQILYQAVIKRRLKALPPLVRAPASSLPYSHTITILDQLMSHLEVVPTEADELASAFYELNNNSAKEYHNRIIDHAKKAALLAEVSWDGKEDALTEWSRKWLTLVDKR